MHADGPRFRSLVRHPKSSVCAAAMLSEVGKCRARYPTVAVLAADGGHRAVEGSGVSDLEPIRDSERGHDADDARDARLQAFARFSLRPVG